VLATINTTDFLYTCPTHLTDRDFATPVGEAGDGAQGARKLGLSSEEIAKVKQEWEEVQRKKMEKDKAKEGEDKKSEEKGDAADESKDKDKAKAEPSSTASPAPTSSHERYTLHRDYFAS
jgi:hypothetical protein